MSKPTAKPASKKTRAKPAAAKKAPAKRAPKARKTGRKPTFTEQARRKQILSVAAKLFLEKGFNSTSLDDIAQEVGVSRGVIFYYFDGKREIGEQTARQNMRRYSNYVRERVEKKRTSRTRLLEFVDACLDYQKDHRDVYLLYIDLIGCFGDSEQKYELTVAMNRRTSEWLIELIEAGQEKGEIARVPARDLADVIQGFVDGLMEMSALDPESVNLDGCKQMIHKMLLSVIEP